MSPAPLDWSYWVPKRLWQHIAARHYGSIVILARVGNWLTPLWIAAMVAGPLLGYPTAVRVVALVALVCAFACYVIYEILVPGSVGGSWSNSRSSRIKVDGSAS